MTSITYNDIPGELSERIKLWETLNKILLKNGFEDADDIRNDIAELKTKINNLLNDVLGIEHDIDGIHNYEESTLKSDIETIRSALSGVSTDINSISLRLNGISNTSTEYRVINNGFTLSTRGVEGDGTSIDMTKNQIALSSSDSSQVRGQISVGGSYDSSGVSISSDNKIELTNRNQQHYVRVFEDSVTVSDINGIVISVVGDSIRFAVNNKVGSVSLVN
jgi:hypothetical protein